MRAPADHTGDGEDWGVELHRQSKHLVYKAGIEVDVDADALVHLTFFGDDGWGETLYTVIKLEFIMQSLFFGKAFYEALEDDSTRVRFGVNRMADAVDQTGVVECVLVEQACEVTADFFIVFPVVYLFFHFLEHLDNLDICAAVAGTL